MADRLQELEQKLGYVFRDKELLRAALTHGSYANEHHTQSYERLEFLGDSILGMAVSEWLYRTFPDEAEGKLTDLRKTAVSAASLGRVCNARGYGAYLRCVKGACGKKVPSDVFEALVAAIYLDGGMERAVAFVRSHIRELLDCDVTDYRSDFKERYEDGDKHTVEWKYESSEQDGVPVHRAIVYVDGREAARAEADSKHAAERLCCKSVIVQARGANDAAGDCARK